MFCKNCGKQLADGTQFCPYCGALQHTAPPEYNAVPTDANGKPMKKLFKKSTIIIICAVAAAVIFITAVIGAVTGFVFHKTHRGYDIEDRLDEYFDNYYDDYDDDDYPWEYFDDDDDFGRYGGQYGVPHGGQYGSGGIYGGAPYGGQYGSGGSAPAASPTPSATPAPWWPADENGKYPTDEGYKWPAGDGKYEYYADSTIPKFESVTGKQPTKAETVKGNTYYTYDLDENAYNEYIKVLEERGFKQSDFEVKGKSSYVTYKLGDSSFYEYLIIYKMNDKNSLIIMA